MAEPSTENPASSRALSRLLFAEVRMALRGYSLSAADRDDLAQKAVETAVARWDTYREDVGSLRQWLRGIVRNEVRLFLRTRRRRAQHEADHATLAPTREARTPEDAVATRDLLDHLLDQVPIEARRVLILVKLADHTIREAAEREGVSHATAHARYQAGLKAFAAAAERWSEDRSQRGLVVLPLSLAAIFAQGRPAPGPDPEFDRLWSHRADHHDDVDSPANRAPIEAHDGAKNRSASGFDTGNRRLVGVLGLLGGALIGGIVEHAWLGRAPQAEVREEPLVSTGPQAVAVPASGTTDVPVVPSAAIETVATPPPIDPTPESTVARASVLPATRAPSVAKPAVASVDRRRLREEIALLDRARSAFDRRNAEDALAALAEHAQRAPDGRGAAERERLRDEATRLSPAPGATAR
ncbi:Hypothetical protein A7982_05990 [Minicystis rosea]|nr:Hypothetical protein A7982_05990 [Minicystis rosea]